MGDHHGTFVLLTEAVFVPAYLVNLGKRAWFRVRMDIPALLVGLRELQRAQGEDRVLLGQRLLQRLDQLVEENDARPTWIEKARQCLKASPLLRSSTPYEPFQGHCNRGLEAV